MNKQKAVERRATEFFELLPQLTPEEFVGILTILSISLLAAGGAPRDFEDVYLDLATKWRDLSPKKQKNLLRLAKAAASR